MAGRILVLFAHPAFHRSRINRALIGAIKGLRDITIHDLYEEYPDFFVNVKREQTLLLEHEVIVLQHPFYWYSSPALVKEWEDLVLQWGFAYGTGGTFLQGKYMLNAITTGGPEDSYNRDGYNFFSIREFLAPFEQTARLCGMHYLPPFVVQGTHRIVKEEDIQLRAEEYRRVIIGLRDEELNTDEISARTYLNAVFASPAEAKESLS